MKRSNQMFRCLRVTCLSIVMGPLAWAQTGAGAPAENQTLSTESVGPVRFIAAHGQRSAMFGYPEEGLEAWAWPFQILDRYKISLIPEGAVMAIPGATILRRIEYRPESITRIYIASDFVLRETIFAPLDRPGVIITYRMEGRGRASIRVQFHPSMNLMWPAAVGGQSVEWQDALHGYLLRDTLHGYAATVSSSEVTAHDGTANRTIRTRDDLSLLLNPRPSSGSVATATLTVAMDDPKMTAGTTAKQILAQEGIEEQEAADHYAALSAHALQITTPDKDVNQALAWAEVALDQAWVCNPQLGCGVVAGYGPSRPERRPQYAWFFAGDGLEAASGLASLGEYERVRQELAFVLRYQNHENGMIWHELSQSAGFLDWTHAYPYMFVHVDVTFQFLAAVADYVQASGDASFARQHWDQIAQAYAYCRRAVDPQTHLPRIPAGKEGSNEQEQESDELSLSAAWMDAASAYAELAQAAGYASAAEQARQESKAAGQAIAARYWDPSRGFWVSAHTLAGKPVFDGAARPVELLNTGVFSLPERAAMLDRIASADYQTDWGTRGIPASTPGFDPDAYAHGSVFALGAATTAAAYWQAHRPAAAFAIWEGLVAWNHLDSLGHIHEVAAGDVYHQEMESVPEQTWSSAGLLAATVHGLLGIRIDGAARSVRLAPHIPPQWTHLSINSIHVGGGDLEVHIRQSMSSVTEDVTHRGDPVAMTFAPEIPQGADMLHATCDGHSVPVSALHEEQDEHAQIQFRAAPGTTSCTITFRGGIAVVPPVTMPVIGDASRGIKVIGAKFADHTFTITADVNRNGPHEVELRTPWRVDRVTGGTVKANEGGILQVQFAQTVHPLPDGYTRMTMTVHLLAAGPASDTRRKQAPRP